MEDLANDLAPYALVIDAFLAGRLPRFDHARHLDVANVLRRLPHGRELMHLGLQVTATRAGKPEKYSAAITDHYWERLDGGLPPIERFRDFLEGRLDPAGPVRR